MTESRDPQYRLGDPPGRYSVTREQAREMGFDPQYRRFQARYREGYYVVIDTQTGTVVPPDPGHYKRHKDGYLWAYAARYAAQALSDREGASGLPSATATD